MLRHQGCHNVAQRVYKGAITLHNGCSDGKPESKIKNYLVTKMSLRYEFMSLMHSFRRKIIITRITSQNKRNGLQSRFSLNDSNLIFWTVNGSRGSLIWVHSWECAYDISLSPVHTSDNVAKNRDIVANNGDIVAKSRDIVAKNRDIVAKNVAETRDIVAKNQQYRRGRGRSPPRSWKKYVNICTSLFRP